MENLLQNLQRTIKALETLSEKGLPQAEQLDELLDQLFQQKIDLQNLNTNTSSTVYQQASQAMGQTASKAEKAAKDTGQVRDLIPAVTDAIGKLAKLLNSAAS
jgi:type I site-specific restriction-modification system R (restriction) subunit